MLHMQRYISEQRGRSPAPSDSSTGGPSALTQPGRRGGDGGGLTAKGAGLVGSGVWGVGSGVRARRWASWRRISDGATGAIGTYE